MVHLKVSVGETLCNSFTDDAIGAERPVFCPTRLDSVYEHGSVASSEARDLKIWCLELSTPEVDEVDDDALTEKDVRQLRFAGLQIFLSRLACEGPLWMIFVLRGLGDKQI